MNIKISEMTSATSLDGTELIPIIQSGVSKKVTKQLLTNLNLSTTETQVGTWIDGKPLYCTVLKKDNLTLNNGYADVGTIANVDSLALTTWHVGTVGSTARAGRTGYLNTNFYSGLQMTTTNTSDLLVTVYAKENTNSTLKFVGTFWYTKTTD